MDHPRRRHHRFEPLSQMQFAWRSVDGEYAISVVSDLCVSGAFIHATEPPQPGTILHILLDAPNNAIRAQAVVRRVVPGQGMGVEFQPMSKDDQARFEILLGVAVPLWREEASEAGLKQREAAKPSANQKDSPASSPRAPGSERRAHIRHKIVADVELVEARTDQLVKGQLADLARMGCFLKTDSFFAVGASVELTMTRNSQSFAAQARVVSAVPSQGMGLTFTRMEPEHSAILDQWLAVSTENSWLSSIRRKSHRVVLNLPVQVAGNDVPGSEFVENTQTISVSADGALLLLSAEVAKGQFLVLSNLRTNAALECSVVYIGKTQEPRREVGVSFTLPNPKFWQVIFPPSGWSPRSPEAKSKRT